MEYILFVAIISYILWKTLSIKLIIFAVLGCSYGFITGTIATYSYELFYPNTILFYLVVPFLNTLQWRYHYRKLFRKIPNQTNKNKDYSGAIIAMSFVCFNLIPALIAMEIFGRDGIISLIFAHYFALSFTGFAVIGIILEYIDYERKDDANPIRDKLRQIKDTLKRNKN